MKNKSGQVGLLLLVVLGLLITLVLSVASRTLSDSVLTRQEKEQSSAFGVAETGVEEALRLIRAGGSLPDGNISIGDSTGLMTGHYNVNPQASLEVFLKEGEAGHINLAGFSGNLAISWTKKDATASENKTCTNTQGSENGPAAMEISVFSAAGAVTRYYYNPYSCSPTGNGFAASDDGGATYRSTKTLVAIPATTSFLRLRPIYNSASVSVSGVSLPSQSYVIQSQVKGGDVSKEIEVKRTIDYPASIFDFAVFSGTTIVK